ncbi:MAG: redoxin family protein [Chloroflexi bacterium]|nr:redoxin family protein [Chloroflexota bacterium]
MRVYADSVVGQGIIVDKSGYVVASSHSVRGSRSIYIELKSGERCEGKILCLNQDKDIAVIKMQGNFPVLKNLVIGDSDFVQQNDEVSVARYLAGSKNLMTSKGTITALPKSDGVNYLQTNAALDVEAAGGALLNKTGELIGVMSWNYGQPGREGYALASNEVASIIAQAQEAEADPLAIVSIEVPSVTDTSAILSWKTNRTATGQVEYGLQAGIYAFKTNEDTTLLAIHGSVVENLQPGVTYYFRAKSIDACGNEVISQDNSFTTSVTAAANKLTIVNINVFNITSSAASVRWITNKPASSAVYYSTDKAGKQQVKTDSNLVKEHEVRLDGLNELTRYFISVRSDAKSESAQAEASTITTPSTAPVCCKVFCRIPDFDFHDPEGGNITNGNISGKETIIVFVTTSCSTCMQQALFLNDFYKNNPGNDVNMLLVASNEKMSEVIKWAKKYGITVPVYLDVNGDLVNTCKLRTIPSWLILDSGSIIKYYKSGGFGSKPEMEGALKQNL